MHSDVSPDQSLTKGPSRAELFLSVRELSAFAGVTEGRLLRLLRLGVIEPIAPDSTRFTVETAMRLKRILRLRRELGVVGAIGASIIVDLLERLAAFEERPRR